MIHSTIPRLHDMCATSIVYRLWTCQDIYENSGEDNHWQLLENKVTSDVNSLPLPELIKSCLSSIVKPSGMHFFGFLHVWLTKIETPEKWLTKGMLCDCLTLYAVGIINQRKTAEKLLRSKTLDSAIAFRLACINFLEEEVLRLWPGINQYILKKIVFQHHMVPGIFPKVDSMIDYPKSENRCGNGYVLETEEVLFWIGYCLAREMGTSLSTVPHYIFDNTDVWYIQALHWASISGDISFFEFASNSSSTLVSFHHEDEIKKLFAMPKNHLISFFYHFSLLKTDEKLELFRKFPLKCLLYFLQWPMSSLFLDNLNHQEMFDVLFRLNLLDWLLVAILEILHGLNYLGQNFWERDSSCNLFELNLSDFYCADHMEQIWVALWKLCPDETKSRIMDSFVFTDNFNSFLEKASQKMNFDASTLRTDTLELFRLNGEAFLQFMAVENLADALEKVISIHMSERKLDFQLLQLPQICNKPNYEIHRVTEIPRFPYIGPRFKYFRIVAGLQLPVSFHGETVFHPKMKLDLREIKNVVAQKFINYILEFLCCNNRKCFSIHKN